MCLLRLAGPSRSRSLVPDVLFTSRWLVPVAWLDSPAVLALRALAGPGGQLDILAEGSRPTLYTQRGNRPEKAQG